MQARDRAVSFRAACSVLIKLEVILCRCRQIFLEGFYLSCREQRTASVADLAGATATSQLNTIWYDNCLPQIPDGNIQPAQESAPAMLVALNSGRCDLVVTDKPTGQAALIAYPDFKLLDFTGKDGEFQVSDEDINIGISLKKGNTELKDAINSVLATMTKDDYNKMMEEAISVQPLSE